MSLNVKLEGDWGKLKLMAIALPHVTDRSNKKAMMKIGLEAERRVVKHIVDQDLGWPDLDKNYQKRKTGSGGRTRKDGGRDRRFKQRSSKILVSSSQMLQSITSNADSRTAIVGVMRGEKYNDGNEVADIAAIHEYGSSKRNIPARPLYRPTEREMVEWLRKNPVVAQTFMQELKRATTL